MADVWLEKLQSAQKTCLIQDGKRKVHFTFPDGTELSEEYDISSEDLVVRKWRKKQTLGGAGKWEFEIGEQLMPVNLEMEGLVESNVNPVFTRKDTKTHFQWRIRNLPYPIDNYKVVAKPEDRQIIISTVNKNCLPREIGEDVRDFKDFGKPLNVARCRYYKKFGVPDLDRCGLPLEQGPIEVAHANNTLIISYKKPSAILDMQKKFQVELKKMKATKDGDVDCAPS